MHRYKCHTHYNYPKTSIIVKSKEMDHCYFIDLYLSHYYHFIVVIFFVHINCRLHSDVW